MRIEMKSMKMRWRKMLSVLATTACFRSLNSPLNGACKNTHQREIKMKNEKNKIKLEQKQQATVKKTKHEEISASSGTHYIHIEIHMWWWKIRVKNVVWQSKVRQCYTPFTTFLNAIASCSQQNIIFLSYSHIEERKRTHNFSTNHFIFVQWEWK